MPTTTYQKLTNHLQKIAKFASLQSLINWDQEVFMPKKAIGFRSEQLAFLSGICHEMFTSDELGELLEQLRHEGTDKNSEEGRTIALTLEDYEKEKKIPKEFVEEMTKTSSIAQVSWIKARKENNFALFKENLKKIVELSRKFADFVGYENSPYDALLGEYERGLTAIEVEKLFSDLAPFTSNLVKEMTEKFKNETPISNNYPIQKQEELNEEVVKKIGFDLDSGRIDPSTHPFCSGIAPFDTRMTTRYEKTDFTSSFFSILHEMGHGLYDQGLCTDSFGLPKGKALSLAIHESQSRFWENHIGRSRAFWDYFFPKAKGKFNESLDMNLNSFLRKLNRVNPSFIRVDADEVSYDLHVILRFEIEKKIIEGELKVEEIPEFWNARFYELFGLKVPDDARGCLQDIHWSMGGFGYFPTYTLGNIYCAQFSHSLKEEIPDFDDQVKKGEFTNILSWLRNNIHSKGKLYNQKELLLQVTGEELNVAYYKKYLTEKYKNL